MSPLAAAQALSAQDALIQPETPVSPLAAAQAGSAENAAIGPETANPPAPAETQWLPLREVIQQYSETTGNRVRINDDDIFDQLYSVNDPSWLEDFNRMEILNEQTGKKEIILLGKRDGSGLNAQTARPQYRGRVSHSSAPGVSGQTKAKKKRKGRTRSPFRRHKK